jgi:hypothetical protein
MPLPSDEKLIQLANNLVQQFDAIFGLHPGLRPAHAKGVLLTGTFSPSPDAASLTRAPHASRESTPVTARFSDSTGLPLIPDNDPNANPRGLAIRFHLAERVPTAFQHLTGGGVALRQCGKHQNVAGMCLFFRRDLAVAVLLLNSELTVRPLDSLFALAIPTEAAGHLPVFGPYPNPPFHGYASLAERTDFL